MYTELDSSRMTWTQKKIVNIKWQIAGIKRHVRLQKSIIKGVKQWWHLRMLCKKANKTLLRKAKEMENRALNKD
jgi:hypothetical protein